MGIVDVSAYVDWLSRVESAGGCLGWVSTRKDFPVKVTQGVRSRIRSPDEIRQAVLFSRRVQKCVISESERRGVPKEVVHEEAEHIITTMGHQMDMCAVRAIGFGVAKTIRTLFDGIFFNASQLAKIREHFKNDSVVFMPTHKTYMDFLLLSLICFDYDVPLPAIAAGMDFMNSKIMGEALRRCGAFFIRRHFGNDLLYWAIFTEYVQTHLIGADHPVEFFLEGTRSRSGKSLYPKYGLLQVLLEPYLRGQLYDMIVVPVTINYDKIVEESLYAYELLGFPKPEESTTGLLRARQVLKKRFGKVFVTFGEPISVRKYFGTSLHRSAFVCQPDSQFTLSEKEKMAMKKFGHQVVRIHNKNSVTGIWPYACTVLLKMFHNCHATSASPGSATFGELLHNLQAFVALAERLGKKIYFSKNLEDDVSFYFSVHSNLFAAPPDCSCPKSLLEFAHFPVEGEGAVGRDFLERSIPEIIFANYSNQMLSEYADLSLLCIVVKSRKTMLLSEAARLFRELQGLFDHEFICLPGDDEAAESFNAAVRCLESASLITVKDGRMQIISDGAFSFLASLILPFVSVYQVTMQTAFGFAGTSVSVGLLVGEIQKRTVELAIKPNFRFLRLSGLSSDPIHNALTALAAKEALIKQTDGLYLVDGQRLYKIASTLQSFSPYDIPFERFPIFSKL